MIWWDGWMFQINVKPWDGLYQVIVQNNYYNASLRIYFSLGLIKSYLIELEIEKYVEKN